MTTLPGQLLLQLLLGLIVAGVLLGALAWLFRWRTRRVIVLDERRDAAAPRTVAVQTSPARRLAMAAVPLALLAWVFAGKFLVRPFYPAQDPSGAAAPAAGPSRTVQGDGGTQLAVYEFGDATGPAVVFTHGWGADHRDWSDLIATLPKTLRIVTWDLPGLGASTEASGEASSVAAMASDLDRVVSSVNGPVVLVGHSVGGILNLEYVRQFGAKLGRDVVGIVQVNTTYTNPVETKKSPETSRQLQKPVYEPALHVVSALSPLCRALGWLAYRSGLAHLQLASQSFAGAQTWSQLDAMARYAYRSSPDVVARGVLGMLHWDGTDVLSKVNVPTLIIAGAEDVTTLPAASERMARTIPSSVQVTVDKAAHLGPVEQHARYAEAIASFVKTR